jgi:alkyl sulfatase BDS1-like metallo-beta-lactamase superfamily hydrolase
VASSPGWGDKLYSEDGLLIYDGEALGYLNDDTPTPPSVNPSLWRQSQLIKRSGLYKVVDGLYQVRLSANLTIVDAPDGLVIIDTTTSALLAKAGLELFRKELNNHKPVVAVIYTRGEGRDRRGGRGGGQRPDRRAGHDRVIRQVRDRRERHHRQRHVPPHVAHLRAPVECDCGLVTLGLSPGVDVINPLVTYISPTDGITKSGETRTLGGWTFEFIYAPDTEAPEEMHIWIPEIKAVTCCRECQPLDAQHPDHPWRPDPGCPELRSVHRRDPRPVGR